jgi:dephospho-CoA kinase
MIKIGVTGNIGSGKTTICSIFEQFGWLVYNSDEKAKWLMINQEKLKKQIIALLGKDSYQNTGQLNRPYIANKIFNDTELLIKLNNIVHPAVKDDFNTWCKVNENWNYVIKESALIYEAQLQNDLDAVVVVTSDFEITVDRVIKRDGLTRNQVLQKLNNQLPIEEKMTLADYVIVNDDQKDFLKNTLEVYRSIKVIYN